MILIIAVLVGAFIIYELAENYTASKLSNSGQSSGNSFIDALAQAIANAENVDTAANNPGALSAGDVDASNITGTFNSAGVVTIDTLENGWNALLNKLQTILSGASTVFSPSMTIQQFAATYTTGDPNDTSDATNGYANSLASDLGVSTDTTLQDAADSYNSGSGDN